MSGPDTTPQTVAEAWLAQLRAGGVDYVFANSGTDFPSIVEAFARDRLRGTAPEGGMLPRPILCAHENTAVSMAHGHAMVSGRAQVAMVHVNVGTANAINGLINAERDHVPLVLAAGMTPLHDEGVHGARNLNIHWAQDMFDQAGMVRETVRASFELRDPRLAPAMTARALALAHSRPAGPVYAMLPREILAMPPAPGVTAAPIAPAPAGHPAPDEIAALEGLLAGATCPVIVTARAGADHAVPERLGRLAARIGAPVVEFRPRHLNLDQEHDQHGGFEIGPWLADADLLIVLECDVPWIPSLLKPRADARIVQVGEDPLHARYPMRSFRSDLTIRASARNVIDALLDALGPRPASTAVVARCRSLRDAARAADDGDRLTMRSVSRCLDRLRAPDSVLVNEYPLVREVMSTRLPGGFYGSSPAGGLGWGVPAALGARLADPDREVIACVGDGSFIFCNPVATLQVAAAERIAILIVVFNNAGWQAVDRATRGMHPGGHAAQANVMPLTRFDPVPGFAAIAEACGCRGWSVSDPALLPGVLAAALAVVRGGTTALVDVRCAG
jgi:acetolactate synthase-1/2/3 large subunit